MKLKKPIFLAALCAVLALSATLVAVSSGFSLGTKISSGSNRGSFVVARTHGQVTKPRAMFIKVTSKPHLKVAGGYTTDCDKNGVGGTRGDQFKGKTPLVIRLKHRFKVPSKCQVTASSQLGGKGRMQIALYAKLK